MQQEMLDHRREAKLHPKVHNHTSKTHRDHLVDKASPTVLPHLCSAATVPSHTQPPEQSEVSLNLLQPLSRGDAAQWHGNKEVETTDKAQLQFFSKEKSLLIKAAKCHKCCLSESKRHCKSSARKRVQK